MQCATCRAIKAIVLHDKTNAIRTYSPSEVQVRAYMIAVDGEPLGTQPPPLEGEVHSSLVTPN